MAELSLIQGMTGHLPWLKAEVHQIPKTSPLHKVFEDWDRRLVIRLIGLWDRMLASLLREVHSSVPAARKGPLPDEKWWKYWEDEHRALLIEFLDEAVGLGMNAGANMLSPMGIAVDWALANETAQRWVEAYGGELITNISGTTKKATNQAVSDWMGSDAHLDDLTQTLTGLYKNPVRARLIAMTESTQAYAQGNMLIWGQSGVVEKIQWQTAHDELVCPICRPLAGTTELLSSSDSGRGFGGIGAPPAHPGCRCWPIPIVEGLDIEPAAMPGGRRYTDPSELEETWVPEYKKFFEKFNHQVEVNRYTGTDEWRFINRALRQEKPLIPYRAETVEGLDFLLAQSGIPEPVVAFRGMTLPQDEWAKLGDLIGRVVEDRAYVSTSLLQQTAEKFATGAPEHGPPVIWEIHVPRGARGLHLGNAFGGQYANEYELLLPRGSKFKVIRVTEREGKKWVVADLIV